MSDIWNAITGAFEAVLVVIHDGIEPVFGTFAWGWAIILLTLAVRLLLMPLAVKQIRSMRAMQELQPKVKALQKKYKTDRDLMRKDPELYRKRKQKLNEETMALYKEEGVNPASGCLPLVAQMPVFLALFSVLRGSAELVGRKFHFFTDFANGEAYADALRGRVFDTGTGEVTEYGGELLAHLKEIGTLGPDAGVDQLGGALGGISPGLDMAVNIAGWPGILLIVLMGVTMFFTQRQMMSRNTSADPQQQQTQKIMMYVMPVFLAFISWGLPLGVLLYWVTTNLWQVLQQQYMLRDLPDPADGAAAARGRRGSSDGSRSAARKGGDSGKTGKISDRSPKRAETSKNAGNKQGKGTGKQGKNGDKRDANASPPPSSTGSEQGPRRKPKKDHLPRRPGS